MSHTQQVICPYWNIKLTDMLLPTFFRRARAWGPSMTGCIVFVSWCKHAFIDAVAFWFSFSCRLRRRTVPLYRSTRPTVAIQVVAPRQHRTTEKAYTWRYNRRSRLTATASSTVKVHMFTKFCFSSVLFTLSAKWKTQSSCNWREILLRSCVIDMKPSLLSLCLFPVFFNWRIL